MKLKLFNYTIVLFAIVLSANVFAQNKHKMELMYNWKDESLVSSSQHNNIYNEVWGFVQNGKEYAVIGSTFGTHIFLLDNPTNPVEVARIPGAAQGTQIVHRDYHDYRGYLYAVCDEGLSTLQIIDLHFLPDSAPVVYDTNNIILRAHNIFIDTAHARMYACGGNSPNQYNVISLADPLNPTIIKNCRTEVPFWSAIGYVHDTYVENNIAYCNAEFRGLFVVDFNDINNPVLLGSLTQYLHQGYNHSGWLNESGTKYAMADETHGLKIKILDVSDPTDIKTLALIGSDIDSLSIVHNLIIKGNYLYASYYNDGAYVFNISDPANPTIDGFYDTSTEPHAYTYRGCWGVYPFLPSGVLIASDMQNGMFLFDVSQAITRVENNIEMSNELKVYPNPANNKIFLSGNTKLNTTYQIYSMDGKMVQSGNITNSLEMISIEHLNEGLYIVRTSDKEQTNYTKFIKQN